MKKYFIVLLILLAAFQLMGCGFSKESKLNNKAKAPDTLSAAKTDDNDPVQVSFSNEDFERLYPDWILLGQEPFSISGNNFITLGLAQIGDNGTKVRLCVCQFANNWAETWHTPSNLDSAPASEDELKQAPGSFLQNMAVITDKTAALVTANVLVGGAHGTTQVISFTVDNTGKGKINLLDSAGIMSVEKQGNYVMVSGESDYSTHKLFLKNGVFQQQIIPLSDASNQKDAIQAGFIVNSDGIISATESSALTAKVGDTIAFVPAEGNTKQLFNEGHIQLYSDAWNGSPLTLCEANRIKAGNSYTFDKPGEVHFILLSASSSGSDQNIEPTFTVQVEK
ncbi:MAG: hypothetical protein ABFD08_13730 [Syntrophomonas sp.]